MEMKEIRTRLDLAKFAEVLSAEASDNLEKWKNRDLSSFLEAMAAWIEDMDGYYQNMGKPVPEEATWMIFAQILRAATIYE